MTTNQRQILRNKLNMPHQTDIERAIKSIPNMPDEYLNYVGEALETETKQ